MTSSLVAALAFSTVCVLGACAAHAATAAPPYQKVLIEDVTLSYDEQSAYQGFTPAQRERIGAAAVDAIRAAVGERFAIVDEPGPGVLRIRAAITGVRAAEKDKHFWSYTPFGLVKGRVDHATGKNIALLSATAEVELRDAETGDSLVAVIDANAGYADAAAAQRQHATFAAVVAKLAALSAKLVSDTAGV